MNCSVDREADVFLLAIGEIPLARIPAAVWHWAICPRCRRSVRGLQRAAARLSPTQVAVRTWSVRLGTLAFAAATASGLWVLSREAVDAAMTAMERPKVKNANYQYEPFPGNPVRPQ